MTKWVNVGASDRDGMRILTKKALKEAIVYAPASVVFDQTAYLPTGNRRFDGAHIPDGVILSVTGPDPHSDRRWYANVVRRPNGKLVVT